MKVLFLLSCFLLSNYIYAKKEVATRKNTKTKEERLDEAYMAIGAYFSNNENKGEIPGGDTELAGQIESIRLSPEIDFQAYYENNARASVEHSVVGCVGCTQNEVKAAHKAEMRAEKKKPKTNNQINKTLILIGKGCLEALLREVVKPICQKINICKAGCYLDVAGDILDLIISSRPGLKILKTYLQTYVLDGGLNKLKNICDCN